MGAYAVVPADLDLDGDLDLVMSHTYGNAVKPYINDGTGEFSDEPDVREAPYYRPR